jgi:hypothetical protein
LNPVKNFSRWVLGFCLLVFGSSVAVMFQNCGAGFMAGLGSSSQSSSLNNSAVNFLVHPAHRVVPSGEFVLLQSLAVNLNSPGQELFYQWYNYGSPIPGATSSSLTIPSLSSADTGRYTVKASTVPINTSVFAVTSQVAELDEMGPGGDPNPNTPAFPPPPPAFSVARGGTLPLSVYINKGFVARRAIWLKNGRDTGISGTLQFIIRNADPAIHDGTYTCVVTFSSGKVEAQNFNVRVGSNDPTVVQTIEVSSSLVNLLVDQEFTIKATAKNSNGDAIPNAALSWDWDQSGLFQVEMNNDVIRLRGMNPTNGTPVRLRPLHGQGGAQVRGPEILVYVAPRGTQPIRHLTVVPSSVLLPLHNTARGSVRAIALDVDGNPIDAAKIEWDTNSLNGIAEASSLPYTFTPGHTWLTPIEAGGPNRLNVRATLPGLPAVSSASVSVEVREIGSLVLSGCESGRLMGGMPARSAVTVDVWARSAGTGLTFSGYRPPVVFRSKNTLASLSGSANSNQARLTLGERSGDYVLEYSAPSLGIGPKDCAIQVTGGDQPVASVTVTPQSLAVRPNGQAVVTAVLKDSAGVELKGRTIEWSSEDTTIATITPSAPGEAVVAGVSYGTTTLTATSEGKTTSFSVTVRGEPTLTLSTQGPLRMTVSGLSGAISPIYTDDRGVVVRIPDTAVGWTSDNGNVMVRVSANNSVVIEAVKAGNTRVTASYAGLSASINVVITAAPSRVREVVATPSSLQLFPGQTSDFVVVQVLDENGIDLPAPEVTWQSMNPFLTVVNGGRAGQFQAGAVPVFLLPLVVPVVVTSEGVSTIVNVQIRR